MINYPIFQHFFLIIFFIDDEIPLVIGIPSDIVQSANVGSSTAVVTWLEPTASDNYGSVNLTSSHSSGSTFSIGDTIVTYTAVDAFSNSANETFTITVKGMNELRILLISMLI